MPGAQNQNLLNHESVGRLTGLTDDTNFTKTTKTQDKRSIFNSVFDRKRAKGDPAGKSGSCRTYIMMRAAPPAEEAPVARVGPRSPDAFYRGEEAGAALKAYR